MVFEIKKRMLRPKNLIMFSMLGVALTTFGIVLLITIDEIEMAKLTYDLITESVYTVVTQFSYLVFLLS